ncbi:MAG: FxsA family protein [Solirubrobacterales bacterium]
MPWLIVLSLIALPVIEIALFVKSSQWIGVLPTIVLAIAAGMAGIALVRRQGFETMMRAQDQLRRGEFPVAEAFDGLCLAMAGALLVLPGFFSDIVALILLLPPVRALLRAWLSGHLRAVTPSQPGAPSGRPPVIEAEYHVVEGDEHNHR